MLVGVFVGVFDGCSEFVVTGVGDGVFVTSPVGLSVGVGVPVDSCEAPDVGVGVPTTEDVGSAEPVGSGVPVVVGIREELSDVGDVVVSSVGSSVGVGVSDGLKSVEPPARAG